MAAIHDVLAVCAIIDPIILTTEFIQVDVEVHAELSVGWPVSTSGLDRKSRRTSTSQLIPTRRSSSNCSGTFSGRAA